MPQPPDERRCQADNADGGRCRRWAQAQERFCITHDPSKDSSAPPPDEIRCTGICTGGTTHLERRGERCRNRAIPGGTVCDYHGAAAPQVRAAANRRVAEELLMRKAAGLVGEPVDNPLTELANLAGRARAFMEMMQVRVETLMDGGDTRDGSDGIRYKGGAGEQLRAEVALYERAMDRLGKFLADYGRLNIDERLATISGAQADRVIAAIEAVIKHLGLTGAEAVEAKKVAARHLRAV